MVDCWNQFPTRRPTFTAIKQRLMLVYDQLAEQNLYVDQIVENALEIVTSQPGEKC